MARNVVPNDTSSEFRNHLPKSDSRRTTLKCSSVGWLGTIDRFVMISVSDLNALLMAQASGARAKAEMARSPRCVPTRPRVLRVRFRRYDADDVDRLPAVTFGRWVCSVDELAMVASLLIRRHPHGAASAGTRHRARASGPSR